MLVRWLHKDLFLVKYGAKSAIKRTIPLPPNPEIPPNRQLSRYSPALNLELI